MPLIFDLHQFLKKFPSDESCLEEIKNQRYPDGSNCIACKNETIFYRIKTRKAYSCKICRHQVYPLTETIFERSATPLRLWFYAMFLIANTNDEISITHLQRELRVTYKTAWRMHKRISDLKYIKEHKNEYRVHKWTFFNKFEFKVVQKQEVVPSEESYAKK